MEKDWKKIILRNVVFAIAFSIIISSIIYFIQFIEISIFGIPFKSEGAMNILFILIPVSVFFTFFGLFVGFIYSIKKIRKKKVFIFSVLGILFILFAFIIIFTAIPSGGMEAIVGGILILFLLFWLLIILAIYILLSFVLNRISVRKKK